ncbi:hypothetical protein [Streptosporangium sp. NPDC023615]|uniref:hypothetical protein n=1 Tax=Streptosporangium sp. NPDC023615 TaxID=3154794 RepID=UPI00341B9146
MYEDPPAPQPMQLGETPPLTSSGGVATSDATSWRFNPDYQRLVLMWRQVLPELDELAASLDKAHRAAVNPMVWDAPVSKRYVEDITEWRNRLKRYRKAILTSISDKAADTPRWIPAGSEAPHAFS